MDKNTLIKVTNRNSGRVGYQISELQVNRQFASRETKEITFDELEKLSFEPGGNVLLKEYLVVKNQEALDALGIKVEPEYFYTTEDVKRILEKGTINEFLDLLDFAPDGVLDEVKDLAVSLPLNDMNKIKAILDKLNFDVMAVIRNNNYKFDGDTEGTKEVEQPKPTGRRAATPVVAERKTETPKYIITQ
jgi:hypothetical protein